MHTVTVSHIKSLKFLSVFFFSLFLCLFRKLANSKNTSYSQSHFLSFFLFVIFVKLITFFQCKWIFSVQENHASVQSSFVVRAWQEGSPCNDIQKKIQLLNKGISRKFSRPLTRGVCDSRRRLKFSLTKECNQHICTQTAVLKTPLLFIFQAEEFLRKVPNEIFLL